MFGKKKIWRMAYEKNGVDQSDCKIFKSSIFLSQSDKIA